MNYSIILTQLGDALSSQMSDIIIKVHYLSLQALSDRKCSEYAAKWTTGGSGFKYLSPKDIHTNNIIQTKHIYLFKNTYVYTSVHIATINLKRGPELEGEQGRDMGGFVGRKGRWKVCNYNFWK